MGRFFRQAMPEFIDDNMFNLPAELMKNVLLNKEKAVDDTLDKNALLLDQLKADVLKEDNPRAMEKIREYEQQINNISDSILSNPMEYNKYTQSINKLGRDINMDWTQGEIGKMQTNKATRVALEKQLAELVNQKDSGVTGEYAKALLAKYDADYAKGLQYNSPYDFQLYNSGEITRMENINDWTENIIKGIAEEGSTWEYDRPSGGYIITKGGEQKFVSKERIASLMTESMKANPELQAAMLQRQGLGMAGFENIFGEDGGLLSPYGHVQDDKGNYHMQFRDNILGHATKAGIDKYAYTKTEDKIKYATDNTQLKLWEWGREDEKEKVTDVFMVNNPEDIESTSSTTVDSHYSKVTTNKALGKAALGDAVNITQKLLDSGKITQEQKDLIDEASLQGDFSLLRKVGDRDAVTNIETSFRNYKINNTSLAAIETQYKNETGGNLSDRKAFQAWLDKKHAESKQGDYNHVNQTGVSFEQAGLTQGDIKGFTEHLNQHISAFSFDIGAERTFYNSKGEKVTLEDSDFELYRNSEGRMVPSQKVKLEALVAKGLAIVGQQEIKRVKEGGSATPSTTKDDGTMDATALTASDTEGNKTEVAFYGANGKIVSNTLSSKSYTLYPSLNNHKESTIGATLTLPNGKKTIIRTSTNNLKSRKIDTYLTENNDYLQFERALNGISNIPTEFRKGYVIDKGEGTVTVDGQTYLLNSEIGKQKAAEGLWFL